MRISIREHRPRPLALLALLATGALLALAGCGGSDDESADGAGATSTDDGGAEVIATSELSKTEWLAEADAICAAANEQLGQVAQEKHGDQKPEGAEFEAFVVEEFAPNFRSQAEQIRELGAPAGDEEQIDAILTKLERGADQIEDDPALADDASADLLIAEAGTEMQAYGATVCGA